MRLIKRLSTIIPFKQPKQTAITPFHYAFPVYDLEVTRHFYTQILGCNQGREHKGQWIDFDMFGHQIVSHKIPYELVDSHKKSRSLNHVDGMI
jgi:extradiol dioxygenase family protein